MNHDPSNPFHKLARDLAAREKAKGAPPRPLPGGIAAPRAPGRGRRDESDGNDGDTVLFLDAVSRIKPLAAPKNKNAGAGESLAGRMRSPRDPFAGPGGARADTPARKAGAPALPKSASPRPAEGVSPDSPAQTVESPSVAEEASPPTALRELCEGSAKEPSREDALFAKAMQGVTPVSGKGRAVALPAGQERPSPAQDPAKALRDVLEGRVEFALHHTGEFMEGHVLGVDPLVPARLRAGRYSPEKHLDMHGMNARQAYDALTWFIRDAYQNGLRCVVVVTGRGRNSPDGVGVLRLLLQRWLTRDPFKRVVLAFCTARPGDGGPGAVYLLLRKHKKNRGRIIWEHAAPMDEDF